jgi:hypothetical protein
MNRGFRGFFAVALIGGVIVAGCGGGGTTTTTNSTTSSAASTTTSTSKAAVTTTSSTTTTSASKTTTASPIVAAIVSACKSQIDAVPTLSASEKSRLDTICKDGASGNSAGAKAAGQQVCEDIVKSALPAGTTQTEALAACKSGKAPTGLGSPTTGTSTPTTGIPSTANIGALAKAECAQYTKLTAALPSSLKNAIASVCAKVDQGDISGAKSQLKQICLQYAQLAGSAASSVTAECDKI